MGSSKNKKAPKPPKIEEAPPVVMEADVMAQKDYMKNKADERMSVQNTLMRNFKKKRKNIGTLFGGMRFPF